MERTQSLSQGQTNSSTDELLQGVPHTSTSQSQPIKTERKARVDAVWQQMNKGVSTEKLNSILNKPSSTLNKSPIKKSSNMSSANWMTYLGVGPKKMASVQQDLPKKQPNSSSDEAKNGTSDEAKRIAAAALTAVKDAAALAAAGGRGKVEITEVRDFAGREIQVKKLVDADSREASEKAKASGSAPFAIDTILEQIKKKPKLSVLDKTKKDWGEFKDENKGMEEELDAYKKSGNQYLEKVSFLQRADYREFERERDVRLALQAKRKADM